MKSFTYFLFPLRGIIFFACFLPFLSWADILQDMAQFYESIGGKINTSTGGAYQDQSAGYYSGGSVFARSRIRNVQPLTLELPGFKAGCSGIDMYMGGLSFIQKEEFRQLLRAIGQNAGGFAMMLALQTVTPQLANLTSNLKDLIQKVTSFTMNSCEMAQLGVGALWPKSQAASEHVCRTLASSEGMAGDWVKARHACSTQPEGVLSRMKSTKGYERMLGPEFNIAWQALKENRFLSGDKELAELLMSLSGTIVGRRRHEVLEIQTLPALADNEALLSALLKGGSAEIYVCDGEACLHPSLRKVEILETKSFYARVAQILEEMVTKILEDQPLSGPEQDFLNATRLPVAKILNVVTTYRRGRSPLDIQEYAELIALDVVHRYILENLSFVQASLSQLKDAQMDPSQIERFEEGLRTAQSALHQRRASAYHHAVQVISMIEKTQMVERQLHTLMGTLSNHELAY